MERNGTDSLGIKIVRERIMERAHLWVGVVYSRTMTEFDLNNLTRSLLRDQVGVVPLSESLKTFSRECRLVDQVLVPVNAYYGPTGETVRGLLMGPSGRTNLWIWNENPMWEQVLVRECGEIVRYYRVNARVVKWTAELVKLPCYEPVHPTVYRAWRGGSIIALKRPSWADERPNRLVVEGREMAMEVKVGEIREGPGVITVQVMGGVVMRPGMVVGTVDNPPPTWAEDVVITGPRLFREDLQHPSLPRVGMSVTVDVEGSRGSMRVEYVGWTGNNIVLTGKVFGRMRPGEGVVSDGKRILMRGLVKRKGN